MKADTMPFGMAVYAGCRPKPPTTAPKLATSTPATAETPTDWLERVSRETGIEMADLRAERDEAVYQLAEARAELDELKRTHAPRWAWPIQLTGWLLAAIGWASLIWGLINA